MFRCAVRVYCCRVQPLGRLIIIIRKGDLVSIYLNRRVYFWFGSPNTFIIIAINSYAISKLIGGEETLLFINV